MPGKRIWMLGLLALGALSCRSTDPAGDRTGAPAGDPAGAPAGGAPHAQAPALPRPADPAPVFADIDPGLDALRAHFQEDDGMVRVIMLVAPT
jgi:hypothetical protein